MPADTYEEAKYNQYSIDVETLLTSGKFNGQHMPQWRLGANGEGLDMLQDQLCRVAQVTPNRKVITAPDSLYFSHTPLYPFTHG